VRRLAGGEQPGDTFDRKPVLGMSGLRSAQ